MQTFLIILDNSILKSGASSNDFFGKERLKFKQRLFLCDFEHGLCGMTLSDRNHFDWYVRSGPSGQPLTGPSSDVTYGTLSGK